MADDSHFVKSCVSIWNGQKCNRKWISDIQNGNQFVKRIAKIKIMVLIWNDKKWFLDIQNGYQWPFKKNLQKSCVRPLGRMHTILVVWLL